jgi:hypothetical protein
MVVRAPGAPYGATRMVDPANALESFQRLFRRGEIPLQRCETDLDMSVHLDHPNGEHRITYVKIRHMTVTAFASLIPVEQVDGVPCFNIGYAVPIKYRGNGRAKNIVKAAIAELMHGMYSRAGVSTLCIEAVVGVDNVASQHVAAATISPDPIAVTDHVSQLPALQYLGKVCCNKLSQ